MICYQVRLVKDVVSVAAAEENTTVSTTTTTITYNNNKQYIYSRLDRFICQRQLLFYLVLIITCAEQTVKQFEYIVLTYI